MSTREKTLIGVIGQGYVGLPLALACAKSGYRVFGIEVDKFKFKALKESKVENLGLNKLEVLEVQELGLLNFRNDYESISECDIVVICVPTPLSPLGAPDLTILKEVCGNLSGRVKEGSLVINESTSHPGTLRNVIKPIFDYGRKEVRLAVAPERIDPGNGKWRLENTPRVVGGIDEESREAAMEFYRAFCNSVTSVSSPEVAEFSKIYENTYRQVNIALVNQLSHIAREMRLSFSEISEAARTKPFGFQAFNPGIGVGGHCIPVDPMYLLHVSKELGVPATIIEHAQSINQQQPSYVAKELKQMFPEKTVKVCLVGLAYKLGSGDLRESPAIELLGHLRTWFTSVTWIDQYVTEWNGEVSSEHSTNAEVFLLANCEPGLEGKLRTLHPNSKFVDLGGRVRKNNLDISNFF